MDNERQKQNHTLYFIGIGCLVIAMALIGFSIYILPHLLFGWVYDVPEFILQWQMDFIRIHGIQPEIAAWIVFLLLLIPGLIAALLATIISNRIDASFYYHEEEEGGYRVKREVGEMINILAKILIIVILIILVIEFLEWLFYIPPPSLPPAP